MLLARRPVAAMAAALLLLALHDAATAATPREQLVVGTSLAQVLSLDPQQATEPKALEIIANLYDRLVSTSAEGVIAPQLAESWSIDDGGITFRLREAKFASGNPVTAADVAFSIGRLMRMNQSGSSHFKTIGFTADNVDQIVRVVDARTVRFDVAGKVPPDLLLYRLALGVASVVDSAEVKKNVAGDDHGNAWLRTRSAGSGPFTLNRWTPNEIIILEANAGYVAGAPKMRRVILRHVPESQVERLMLERGDIDIANAMTAADLTTFAGKPGFVVQRVPTGGFYALAMNAGNPYLANPKVREAIAHGIDYAGIEKTVMGPYGTTRTVPVPASYEHAIPDPGWKLDPAKAKVLLAEAGYPEGFSLTLKTIAQTPRVDLATALQASLGQIGIRIEIQQGNGSEIISAHRARNFELLLPQTSAFMPNVLGAMYDFANNPDNSKEANNAGNFVWRSAWDIPELTKLTAQASAEKDPAKRAETYVAMQKTFVALRPAVLPLFERFEPIVLVARVKGYAGHPNQMTRLEKVTKDD